MGLFVGTTSTHQPLLKKTEHVQNSVFVLGLCCTSVKYCIPSLTREHSSRCFCFGLFYSLNVTIASKLWASRAASYLRISTFHRGFATVIKDLHYADSHEWVKIDGNSATVGITDHAQDHLGDVVYVELPEVGASVAQSASFGAVESVKATSDINAPVSGKVVEVNEKLSNSPDLVNASPYEDGWIIKVEIANTDEVKSLMDADQYSKFCEEEDAKH